MRFRHGMWAYLAALALLAGAGCGRSGNGTVDEVIAGDSAPESELPATCTRDAECDSGNDCLVGACQEGKCVYSVSDDAICCTADADCDDGSACTTDRCLQNTCRFENPDPACCKGPADCDDGDPCTTDACGDAGCTHQPTGVAGCCSKDADCDDTTYCTLDYCAGGACHHVIDSSLEGCSCTSTQDCDDGDPCTMEACLSFKCDYKDVFSTGTPGPGCCRDASDCDDQDPTTLDTCKTFTCDHAVSKACAKDVNCDDQDFCTRDACVDGHCANTPKELQGCCTTDAQCVQGNVCLTSTCANHVCDTQLKPDAGCCDDNADCDDQVACTVDSCSGNLCQHQPTDANCCASDLQCADTNPCTADLCVQNQCTHTQIQCACQSNADCDDHKACTTDTCANQTCTYQPVANCCESNADCEDGNACTSDTCTASGCKHAFIPNCCVNAGQCNDGEVCTIDTCDLGTNTCVFTPKDFCCKSDAECTAGDVCKIAKCQAGNCVDSPKPDCCLGAEDCKAHSVECATAECLDNACKYTLTDKEGCCITKDDCQLPNACQAASCEFDTCQFTAKPNCCLLDEECDDGDDLCTVDTCTDNVCKHALSGTEGCCLAVADCGAQWCQAEGGPCMDDWCLTWACTAHQCVSTPIPECCHVDEDCDDGDADVCTTDHCVLGTCVFASTLAADCCTASADCVSLDACQKGTCGGGKACVFSPVTGCCNTDAECDDGDDLCTIDSCVNHACKYKGSGAEGCCEPFSVEEGFENVEPPASGMYDGSYADWVFMPTADFGSMETWMFAWQVPQPTNPALYKFHGGAHALYYGWTASGIEIMGIQPSYKPDPSGGVPPVVVANATGPEVLLPEGQLPELRFFTYVDIETDPLIDLFSVNVLVNGQLNKLWDKTALDPGTQYKAWQEVVLDLSPWAGETVQVVFAYDAVQVPTQDLEGIYVDDLQMVVDCGQ